MLRNVLFLDQMFNINYRASEKLRNAQSINLMKWEIYFYIGSNGRLRWDTTASRAKLANSCFLMCDVTTRMALRSLAREKILFGKLFFFCNSSPCCVVAQC